jgi:hypothetical protein
MRKNVYVAALAAMLTPGLALAATPQNFRDLANQIVQLLGSATTDLVVLAIVIYFWGISSSLFKQGSGESKGELRKMLLWGVFILFFAVSIWGVITILQSTVFGSNLSSIGASGPVQNCTGLNCQFGTK